MGVLSRRPVSVFFRVPDSCKGALPVQVSAAGLRPAQVRCPTVWSRGHARPSHAARSARQPSIVHECARAVCTSRRERRLRRAQSQRQARCCTSCGRWVTPALCCRARWPQRRRRFACACWVPCTLRYHSCRGQRLRGPRLYPVSARGTGSFHSLAPRVCCAHQHAICIQKAAVGV